MTTQTETKPASQPTRALTPFDEVRRTLMSDEMKAQLSMALPPQMPPEKFQRVAITAVNKNADLLDCTRQSLYGAFMLAAQDGLLPDGREAAIVKYMNKGVPTATYMPMVGGILKKVRNSGELAAITAQLIHKADDFRYWVDDSGEHLKHEPLIFGERGELIGVYALAKTKDGSVYTEVMTKEDVEKVRSISRARDTGPWVQWWGEMAKKTVIRRLSKRLPMSTDLDELIRRDDELYDVDPKAEAETAPRVKSAGPGRLTKLLGEPGKVIEGTARVIPPKDEPAAETPEAQTIAEDLPVAGSAPKAPEAERSDADDSMTEQEKRQAVELEKAEAKAPAKKPEQKPKGGLFDR